MVNHSGSKPHNFFEMKKDAPVKMNIGLKINES